MNLKTYDPSNQVLLNGKYLVQRRKLLRSLILKYGDKMKYDELGRHILNNRELDFLEEDERYDLAECLLIALADFD